MQLRPLRSPLNISLDACYDHRATPAAPRGGEHRTDGRGQEGRRVEHAGPGGLERRARA